MKKTVFSGLFSLVILSTIVVLGNSPRVAEVLVQTARLNSFISLFQAHEPVEGQSKEWDEFRKSGFGNHNEPTSKKKVPEYVLWRMILSKPERLREKALRSGADVPESPVLDFLGKKAGLSLADAEIFTRISAEYLVEAKVIDFRMETITKERKVTRENLKKLSREHLVARNKEFLELQKQHNHLALNYKEKFRNAVSPDSYSAFERWLTTEFAANITNFSGGSNANPEPFHFSPGKPGKGFKPIQDPENSEVKP